MSRACERSEQYTLLASVAEHWFLPRAERALLSLERSERYTLSGSVAEHRSSLPRAERALVTSASGACSILSLTRAERALLSSLSVASMKLSKNTGNE